MFDHDDEQSVERVPVAAAVLRVVVVAPFLVRGTCRCCSCAARSAALMIVSSEAATHDVVLD